MADPTLKIKRSAVEGKIPTAEQLPLGEISLNTYDGKFFASKNVGIGTTVFVVNPWSVGTGTNTYNAYFTAGNVGISTTNPSSKLHVYNGDLELTGGYNLTWGGTFSGGNPTIWGNSSNKTIRFAPDGNTTGLVALLGASSSYILGNVGIETTNPLYKLDVRGGSWINGASIQGASVSFGASPVTKTITISTSNTEAITIVASGFTSGGGHSAVKQFMVGGYIPGSTQYAAATVSSATTGSSMSISDITKANNSFSFTMTLSASLNSQGEISVLSRYPVTITIS